DVGEEEGLRLMQKKEEGPDVIGHHPERGEPIFLLNGRFGPYVQLGEADSNGGKPRRASLLKGMKPENVTLDIAVNLLKLPRPLGFHPETGKLIEAGVGRFGPFIKHDDDFRPLTHQDHVFPVDLDRALDLLSQPKAGRAQRAPAQPIRELGAHPEDGEPITLMSGRFGPYVKHGSINATLPRQVKPESVTLDQAVALIT